MKSAWSTLPLLPSAISPQWTTLGFAVELCLFNGVDQYPLHRRLWSQTLQYLQSQADRSARSSAAESSPGPLPVPWQPVRPLRHRIPTCTGLFAFSIHRFSSALSSSLAVDEVSSAARVSFSAEDTIILVDANQTANGTANASRATGHQRARLFEDDAPRIFPTRLEQYHLLASHAGPELRYGADPAA